MTATHSIESGNLGESSVSTSPAPSMVEQIPSQLYRIVRVPIDRDKNWTPKGIRSIPPVMCKGLSLSVAVEMVVQRNRRIREERRHKWYAVVLTDKSVSEFSYGVASLFITPEEYPESLSGLPACRVLGAQNGILPDPLNKSRLNDLWSSENYKVTCIAWIPRCWHMLSPVV